LDNGNDGLNKRQRAASTKANCFKPETTAFLHYSDNEKARPDKCPYLSGEGRKTGNVASVDLTDQTGHPQNGAHNGAQWLNRLQKTFTSKSSLPQSPKHEFRHCAHNAKIQYAS